MCAALSFMDAHSDFQTERAACSHVRIVSLSLSLSLWEELMTQKGDLFKGQQKKNVPANRHGKQVSVRKGKVFKKPSKKTEEMEVNKEVQKFIDQANEAKAAAIASKEGARLTLIKAPEDAATTSKKFKSLAKAKK